MSVIESKTVRQIAKELGIDKKTVTSDIRAESQRRANELAERRELEQTTQIARLDHLFSRSLELATEKGLGALAAAARCLEMRGRLLGLDRVAEVDERLVNLLRAMRGLGPLDEVE